MRELKIGILQQHNVAERKTNMTRLAQGIADLAARGAKLIILQELHNSLYFCQTEDVDNFALAEPIPGPSTNFFGELAKELGVVLPISFFESPHYKDTPEQQKIIEKYFQFIYEPFNNSTINIYKNKNNNLYIPTPLGYLNKPDDTSIVDALNSDYNPEKLHSFFYHPSIEVEFINFNTENNKLNVSYDPNSPLQKIVKALKDNEYSTVHVDELIDK